MRQGEIRGPSGGKAAVAGLLLLCSLSSLASLRMDLLPHLIAVPLPPWQGQTIAFALLSLVASAFAVWRGAAWPRGPMLWNAMLVGAGLFLAPAVAASVCAPWVSSMMRVVVFALTPVFAVVFEPYLGRDAAVENRGGIAAALAAVAGVLCVFPVEVPRSFVAGFALCAVLVASASVAAANCRAVRMAGEMAAVSFAPVVAIAAITAAVGLAAISAIKEHLVWKAEAIFPAFAWAAVAELPALLLLFWLMRRMSAVRMTTRYVLTPLIAILVSAALLRPDVGIRGWLGIVLMAAGSGWLLLAPGDGQPTDNSLLGLHG